MRQPSHITALPALAFGEGNNLIDRLPREERRTVLDFCTLVELTHGTVLCEPYQPIDYVYFPVSGCISLVKTLHGHEPLDTVLIGCEGMLGATLVLGMTKAPLRALVQSHGMAMRMTPCDLQASLDLCPALLRALKCYVFLVMVKLAQTAACAHFHDVGSRLARGLLMTHDRARSNHFQLTHQTLANMLGVQRGAVTIAAGLLQQKNIIHYTRGKITILDRGKLEDASCECYVTEIDDYSLFNYRPNTGIHSHKK